MIGAERTARAPPKLCPATYIDASGRTLVTFFKAAVNDELRRLIPS